MLGSGLLPAQTNAPSLNIGSPETTGPAEPLPTLESPAAATPATNSVPVATSTPAAPSPVKSVPAIVTADSIPDATSLFLPVLVSLLTLGALGGFLLYQSGLTRAKNCGHAPMLLFIGVSFGLIGYWMGGFAVQTGGISDTHAAGTGPLGAQHALDHELGFMAGGHHWGVMGSAGFFLMTDIASRETIAALFFVQAVFLALAVAAALGAALERGRILALGSIAFVTGAVIYPLMANWIWGGGWLAELGREFGLGHGVVDLAGAGVVHETAGTLALVIALVLGPRHGRFTRNKATGIPGHNVPFIILGTLLLLAAFIASASSTGLAAANVLIGALGAMFMSCLWGVWRHKRPTPARLSRGLLGGAVALCGGGGFFDSWAAFLTGACAGLLMEGVVALLERREIDDPSGAVAIHGAGGAWGLLATGFFANGIAGHELNGVDGPVRGLLFGGGWHQLAAQAIGCATDFIVVFVLGYLTVQVVQKILGLRVKLADELQGIDWPQLGALGYQPDVESDELE